MKRTILLFFIGMVCATVSNGQVGLGSRMNEVFQRQDLASGTSGAFRKMRDPWEIAYGPDAVLWITEARTYKVTRMDPSTGTKTVVLDLGSGTFTPASYNRQFPVNQGNWPQGGMMGLAFHPTS
jgi:streptogramin lyase